MVAGKREKNMWGQHDEKLRLLHAHAHACNFGAAAAVAVRQSGD